MNMYYGILVWFVVAFLITKTVVVKQPEYILGKKVYRYQWIAAIILFSPLIIWAGNRREWFGDTHMYKVIFTRMPASLGEIITYIKDNPKDKGFSVLSIVIKSVFGSNPKVYLWCIAIIQGICVIVLFRKYSEKFLMSIFIFVTSTDYFSFMHNGIRQFVAVSISLLGFKYLVEKKYIRYIAIILFASTFHQSALILLPIALIVQGKPWNKKTVLMLVAALVAVRFVGGFTTMLDNMLSDTQYTNVVSDWKEWNDDGTNPFRVAVYAVPAILSIIGFKYIKAADDPVINLSTNMALVTTGIYIVSMFTSGIFIGRLPIYTSMYSMGILLPWEIDHIFEKKSAFLVNCCMILAFVSFYYYQMHFAWGAM